MKLLKPHQALEKGSIIKDIYSTHQSNTNLGKITSMRVLTTSIDKDLGFRPGQNAQGKNPKNSSLREREGESYINTS